MGEQRVLDLLRVDLLAAGVDDAGAAAEKPDGAVLLDHRQVAWHGVADPVDGAERGRGLGGVLVVPERYRPAEGEHADLPAAWRHRRVAGQHLRGGGRVEPGRQVVDGRGDRVRERAPFARGDRVGDRDAGALMQSALQPVAQHGARADHGVQRAEVVRPSGPLRGGELVDERLAHRVAGYHERAHPLSGDGLPDVPRVQPAGAGGDHPAACQQRAHRVEQPGRVHQRDSRHHDGRPARGPGGGRDPHRLVERTGQRGHPEPLEDRHLHGVHQVRQPPDHALRLARRAAGVHEELIGTRPRPGRARRVRGEQLPELSGIRPAPTRHPRLP